MEPFNNRETLLWKARPLKSSSDRLYQNVTFCNLCPAERKRSEDHIHGERRIQHLHSGGPGSGTAVHRDHHWGERWQDGRQKHDNIPDL